MQLSRIPCVLLFAFIFSCFAAATIFSTVRGIVHDPQHRPVQGAQIILRARASDWKRGTTTNNAGEFAFPAVPGQLLGRGERARVHS